MKTRKYALVQEKELIQEKEELTQEKKKVFLFYRFLGRDRVFLNELFLS